MLNVCKTDNNLHLFDHLGRKSFMSTSCDMYERFSSTDSLY